MRIQVLFPFLLILSVLACKKPPDPYALQGLENNEPIIFNTSLRDTIPAKALAELNLNHITGIKVTYPSGQYASYFEYEADHRALIHTIGSLPFPIFAELSDTTCHTVPFDYIKTIRNTVSRTEISSSAFWYATPEEYTAYECLKAPFKHTLLLSKRSKRVLHRVEFVG